jgi:hypothetical protein
LDADDQIGVDRGDPRGNVVQLGLDGLLVLAETMSSSEARAILSVVARRAIHSASDIEMMGRTSVAGFRWTR